MRVGSQQKHKDFKKKMQKNLHNSDNSSNFALANPRSDARVAEEARLESVYTPKGYPEFESRSLRKKRAENQQNTIDLSAFNFLSESKKSFKKNDWKDEKGRKWTKRAKTSKRKPHKKPHVLQTPEQLRKIF